MCISTSPSKMSDTIVLASEGIHPETGKLIHILGYQNIAKSETANCMILTIPNSDRVAMSSKNMLDMTKFPDLLKDYAKPFQLRDSRCSRSIQKTEIFTKGSYTVLLSGSYKISQAVLQLPADIRPNINSEFDDFLAQHRNSKNFVYALCCWKGDIEPEPLVWWYEPKNPEYLFLPGLDGHDGKVPNFSKNVARDHTLVVGNKMGYPKINVPDELKNFFPEKFVGAKINHYTSNCDWAVPVNILCNMKYGLDQLEENLIPIGANIFN